MTEKHFNLVDSPWILVEDDEEKTKEVSLETALIQAQNFRGLAGETAAQNAAVLRLLIAITHTVLMGMDPPIEDDMDALDRWDEVWQKGKLPEEEIKNYLNHWKDKFWLIDPDGGFLQTNIAKIGTEYKAPKLMGDLSESNNKIRLFQLRSGKSKDSLEFAEAARWLLNVNAYDDTSAKAKGKKEDGEKFPSTGAGWLGKLGQIYAAGQNLFETIMLNTVLLRDGETTWGEADSPYWEKESEKLKQRELIDMPDNLAQLLTLPSRLLLLQEENGRITGFNLLGGLFFEKTDAFNEQFTMWRAVKGKKNEPTHYVPRRHDASRQIWRDFSSIAGFGKDKDNSDIRLPGIVQWIKVLKTEGLLPVSQPIEFQMPFVQYGDKDFFVTDTSTQSLLLYPDLLTDSGESWRDIIEEEISKIDQAAFEVGRLSQNVAAASGNSGESAVKFKEKGRSMGYEAADEPFRVWLRTLDPEIYEDEEARQAKRKELQQTLRTAFLRLEHRVVGNPPVGALFSRKISKGENKQKVLSVPEAAMWYEAQINRLYPITNKKEGDTE